MTSLLIEGGYVLSLNPRREIIRDGAVVVKGDKIDWVGKRSDLDETRLGEIRRGGAKTIDATGKLVLPGLVDAHVHNSQMLARGIADDVDLLTWLYDRILPYEALVTEEDAYISTLLCCMEMIRTGTTATADPGSYRMDQVARAMADIGIRGFISWAANDESSSERALPKNLPGNVSTEESIQIQEQLIRDWQGAENGRIHVSYAIRTEANASEKLLKEIHHRAQRDGLMIQMHTAVTPAQVEWIRKKTGMTSVEFLNSIGCLGPNWLLTHMACLTDREVDLLAETDTRVCHCPGASLKCVYGAVSRGKFPEMLAKGVTVALGCDASAANNSLDMFRALYHAATAHKEARMDVGLIPPEKALEMATLDGARALKLDHEVGSVEPGKKADLIVVNTRHPNWIPVHEFSIVPNIVYAGDGHDVETSIIDGRVVLENGRLTTINEEDILEEAQKAARRLIRDLPYRLEPRWPVV
ncbi:MAG: amidohydrolase family protein [Nitrospinota bacterium]